MHIGTFILKSDKTLFMTSPVSPLQVRYYVFDASLRTTTVFQLSEKPQSQKNSQQIIFRQIWRCMLSSSSIRRQSGHKRNATVTKSHVLSFCTSTNSVDISRPFLQKSWLFAVSHVIILARCPFMNDSKIFCKVLRCNCYHFLWSNFNRT